MNKWEAIWRIVKLLVERDRTAAAVTVFTIFSLVGAAPWIIVALLG